MYFITSEGSDKMAVSEYIESSQTKKLQMFVNMVILGQKGKMRGSKNQMNHIAYLTWSINLKDPDLQTREA